MFSSEQSSRFPLQSFVPNAATKEFPLQSGLILKRILLPSSSQDSPTKQYHIRFAPLRLCEQIIKLSDLAPSWQNKDEVQSKPNRSQMAKILGR